jgi:hypothetical protein
LVDWLLVPEALFVPASVLDGLLASLPAVEAPVPAVEDVPLALGGEPVLGAAAPPAELPDEPPPAPPDDCANANAALHINRVTAAAVLGTLSLVTLSFMMSPPNRMKRKSNAVRIPPFHCPLHDSAAFGAIARDGQSGERVGHPPDCKYGLNFPVSSSSGMCRIA